MAILPLIIAPDPRLKTKSAPVEAVNDEVRALMEDMLETMYASHGIGLAAVQVGIHKKVIVIDTEWRDRDDAGNHVHEPGKPMKFINAEIVWDSEEPHKYNEGCLSFPDQFSEVERPKEVKVKYLDENGAAQELHATGLLATCIQHEIDHTNGITFVDHISPVKKDMILRKLTKMKKTGNIPVRTGSPYQDHDHDHVHGEHCNH